MKKTYLFSIILLSLTLGLVTPAFAGNRQVKKSVLRGNVVRDSYNPAADAGCYLANGRFGAVYGGLGLNLSPEEQETIETGPSHFSHIRHWGRFTFISAIEKTESTADYLLPMFKLYWEDAPSAVTSYSQIQNFYDGTLTTSFKSEDGTEFKVIGWFDNVNKDLAGLKIFVSRDGIAVKTSTFTDFQAYPYVFRDKVFQETGFVKDGDNWKMSISCPQSLNGCASDLYFFTDASAEPCENGARIILHKGWNEIFISYGKPVTPKDRKLSLKRSTDSWHSTWCTSAWMDFPDQDAQKFWVRSLAYLMSSYDDFEPGLIQPTNGLSGNTFPFHFVQDLEYIAPALMMTGHNDIVMNWVEKFASEIEPMKLYAKHLWPEAEGVYPPWELPFGDIEGYHSPTIPVAFCREPHNPGYLCRLAVEAGEFAGDAEWTENYVFPLVREVCNFYKAACHKEEDGLWHLGWYPSIGQDEAGGRNKTDYLCSLYSAEYSFRTAVDLGLDEDGSLAGILRDGLAFESLMSERGTLHTCKGADDFGIQKHPVQLDGLSYFPRKSPSDPERKAYSLRYGITDRANDPHFFGWTLGQFLLSASNLGDARGWRKDWDNVRASNYTDPEWIQVYETSGNHNQSFYVTTHGMIEQSLIRNYVNDYWGVLDIASCPAFEGKVSFVNIDTRLGVRVSGTVDGDRYKIRLKALRDCTFTLFGDELAMRKGESRTIRSGRSDTNRFTILCGKEMSDTLRIPVNDLKSYIERSVPGSKVTIQSSDKASGNAGHVIVIQDDNDSTLLALKEGYGLSDSPAEWNSFRISSFARKDDSNHNIYFLEGADIWGKQYAVYDLAERLLGVRYLKPELDHIVVQKHFKAIQVNTGIEKPDYKWRGLYPWNYNYEARGLSTFCDINVHFEQGDWDWYRSLCDWMVKNKQNAVLWFDDVFAHENISGQFPDEVSDYYAMRGIRQILGMGWASNEDRPRGDEWHRDICLGEDGKTVEDASWKQSICPMSEDYFPHCDKNFENLKLDHPENYIGALIGYGENTWACHEEGAGCVRHKDVKSSTLMLRDFKYVSDKFRNAGFTDLPLGFVTCTYAVHPGTPFEADGFLESLPGNSIFTMHTYQQSSWKQFERLYDKIDRMNREDGTDFKVFHISEAAFICGADIPLLKPSILRRRSEHYNTLPRQNTIGHLATLNTTQYLYWYDTYQFMKWQWHKDDRNWTEYGMDNFSAIFGHDNAVAINEILNRLDCLEYVLPYSQNDSLVNAVPDMLPPRQWGRYNTQTHPDEYGFLLWADVKDPDALNDAEASIKAVLDLNDRLNRMDDPLYKEEFYTTVKLTAEYYGIRVCTGKYRHFLEAGDKTSAAVEREKAIAFLDGYNADLSELEIRNPYFLTNHKEMAKDLVFNPSREFFDEK